MTKFNVGDQIVVHPHQWNIKYSDVNGPVVGTVLRVTSMPEGRTNYLVDHPTADGGRNQIWTEPREDGDLIAHVGGPFQIGDRVVYTGEETQDYKGLVGTVERIESDGWLALGDTDRTSVTDRFAGGGFSPNFSLLSRPTEPDNESDGPAPADGELQALRERLLALAVKAYVDEAHQSIVETASMFENYITGGTK